jgi:hypothetical protein
MPTMPVIDSTLTNSFVKPEISSTDSPSEIMEKLEQVFNKQKESITNTVIRLLCDEGEFETARTVIITTKVSLDSVALSQISDYLNSLMSQNLFEDIHIDFMNELADNINPEILTKLCVKCKLLYYIKDESYEQFTKLLEGKSHVSITNLIPNMLVSTIDFVDHALRVHEGYLSNDEIIAVITEIHPVDRYKLLVKYNKIPADFAIDETLVHKLNTDLLKYLFANCPQTPIATWVLHQNIAKCCKSELYLYESANQIGQHNPIVKSIKDKQYLFRSNEEVLEYNRKASECQSIEEYIRFLHESKYVITDHIPDRFCVPELVQHLAYRCHYGIIKYKSLNSIMVDGCSLVDFALKGAQDNDIPYSNYFIKYLKDAGSKATGNAVTITLPTPAVLPEF